MADQNSSTDDPRRLRVHAPDQGPGARPAKPSPRTLQSGAKNTSAGTGKGNPWLRGALGEAAMAASLTDTFLGERYRRIVKRRGHMKALVAVARSILVIVWHHLLTEPDTRFQDLGSDFHAKRLDPAWQNVSYGSSRHWATTSH
ncbi:hypothetical protein [Streptomyces sp. NPDC059761]|uniref:hypothetical protein n=1 Tax=Streptomyces sp. NPDC059761 TaxID=3346937 RepID=UPI00364F9E8F